MKGSQEKSHETDLRTGVSLGKRKGAFIHWPLFAGQRTPSQHIHMHIHTHTYVWMPTGLLCMSLTPGQRSGRSGRDMRRADQRPVLSRCTCVKLREASRERATAAELQEEVWRGGCEWFPRAAWQIGHVHLKPTHECEQLPYTHFGGRDKFHYHLGNDNDVTKDSQTYLQVDLNFLRSQTHILLNPSVPLLKGEPPSIYVSLHRCCHTVHSHPRNCQL